MASMEQLQSEIYRALSTRSMLAYQNRLTDSDNRMIDVMLDGLLREYNELVASQNV